MQCFTKCDKSTWLNQIASHQTGKLTAKISVQLQSIVSGGDCTLPVGANPVASQHGGLQFSHSKLLGGSSPGAEEHATRMFDAFNTDGYIASLDYSQCYDHVIPADACQAMAMLGLPNALTSTLQFHWEHQVRYIDWNRFVDPVPMRTSTGIPQGDGLSPLSLACLMTAGLNFVKDRCPAVTNHCVYIDDRTWTAHDPSLLTQVAAEWRTWSVLVGLKEHMGKTQYGATTPARQGQMKAISEDHVKDYVDVLGVTMSSTKNRKPTAKEVNRQKETDHVTLRTGLLPISREAKHGTVRAVAMAKASYGWVSRKPTEKETNHFDQAVWRACNEPHQGGPHHKRMLLQVGLDGPVGAKQTMRMSTRQHRCRDQPLDTQPSDKHPVQWLHDMGWMPQPNQSWKQPDLKLFVEPLSRWDPEDRSKAAHDLRESWRRPEWSQLCSQSTRHQTPEYAHEVYDSERVGNLRKEIATSSGPKRWLMLGAARSPLEHKKARRSLGDACCPNQGCSVKDCSWNHALWECPKRDPVRLNHPESGLLKRYGWSELETDPNLIQSMVATVLDMWQSRVD